MSRILLANCAHETETANSQVLPCNTVPCFTVRVQILSIAAILRDRVVFLCYEIAVGTELFDYVYVCVCVF